MASPPKKMFAIDPKLYQRQAFGNDQDQPVRQFCKAGPSAAATKMKPLPIMKQDLDWQNIPSLVLATVAQLLPMADRKTCTLVCRRWNSIVFGSAINNMVTFPLSKWKSESYVPFDGFHRMMQRSYRKVEISWVNYADSDYLRTINGLFETLPKYELRKLTLNVPPDETLGEFFERHRSIWERIQQLHVYIGSPLKIYPMPADDVKLDIRKVSINMPMLECLEWREGSLGNISHGRQVFVISAPRLEYAKVHTFRHWNCYSVLNIKSCTNLRNAFLDIPNRIWRTFHQCISFGQLRTLNFGTESREYPIENITPVQFDQLFATMKNLQAVKISGLGDSVNAPLVAVCRRCPLIWSVELDRFEVDAEAFLQLIKLKNLKRLFLTNGKIINPKVSIFCRSLQDLWLRNVELVGGDHKAFPIKLNDAMKRRLLYTTPGNDVVICNYSMN
nr:uncharacterized protein LOC109412535 [Aedes albopictus]